LAVLEARGGGHVVGVGGKRGVGVGALDQVDLAAFGPAVLDRCPPRGPLGSGGRGGSDVPCRSRWACG